VGIQYSHQFTQNNPQEPQSKGKTLGTLPIHEAKIARANKMVVVGTLKTPYWAKKRKTCNPGSRTCLVSKNNNNQIRSWKKQPTDTKLFEWRLRWGIARQCKKCFW